MTAAGFRRIALAMRGVEERSHMAHPDFRINGKIFATLGYPRAGFAMVKLTSDQQEMFMKLEPDVFVPVKGKWGAKGATNIILKNAKSKIVREALLMASKNV
jgi:hypothetical protein